jgi:rare lipoprotein A
MKFISTCLLLLITSILVGCGDRPLPPNTYPTNAYPPVQSSYNNQTGRCSSPPFYINEATRFKLQQPYNAGGETFFPISDPRNFIEEGEAAWYGSKFHGKFTASGEVYNQNDMTAAHPALPMNSCIKVTNLRNNAVAYLRVNDRGPSIKRRVLDVSVAAAKALGFYRAGVTQVRIEFMY